MPQATDTQLSLRVPKIPDDDGEVISVEVWRGDALIGVIYAHDGGIQVTSRGVPQAANHAPGSTFINFGVTTK